MNSIIAEKLIAMEFDKKIGTLTESQSSFIKGRKEQAMRHLMYKIHGYDKIEIDNTELEERYNLRNRVYELVYINMPIKDQGYFMDIDTSDLTETILQLGLNVKKFYKTLSYNDDMLPEIKKELFLNTPVLHNSYGPFLSSESSALFFQIKGWEARVMITEKEKLDIWTSTLNEYKDQESLRHYSEYISTLMKGKQIELNAEIFLPFAAKVSDVYNIKKTKRDSAFNQAIWDGQKNISYETLLFDSELGSAVLLEHDGKKWIIDEIMDLIRSHPLVFRNKNIPTGNFEQELKLAVADLIRDWHITQKAYQLGYDRHQTVIQNQLKWEDYVKSKVMEFEMRNADHDSHNTLLPSERMMKTVDSLQIEYSSRIKINTDMFEEIELTQIDMFTILTNDAYPIIEPGFPILTKNHRLDYGSQIKLP